MRPLRTKLQSIGRFRSLQLDLTDLPENALLIAYDGAPGAGKSTLFRSLTWGAVFRKFKNSGSLKDLASGPDACLETDIEFGGKRYTAKHLVDGKQGASVLIKDGEKNDKRAKKKEFKASVEETFPPELLLSNTVWRDQKSLGFLELEQSDRRELILLATGATQWQQWFTQANAKANEHKELRAAHAAKATALQGQFKQDEFDNRENRLCQLQGEAFLANEAYAQAQRFYQEKQNGIAMWESASASYTAWQREQLERQGRINQIENKLANIVGQQMNLDALMKQAVVIREAHDTLPLYRDSLLEQSTELEKLRGEMKVLESRQRQLQSTIDDAQLVCRKIEETEELISGCKQAALMVEELKLLVEAKRGALRFACESLEGMRNRLTGSKNSRISSLRRALEQIEQAGCFDDAKVWAHNTLIGDDRELLEELNLPGAISNMVREIEEAKTDLKSQESELSNAVHKAGYLAVYEDGLNRLTMQKLQRDRAISELKENIETLRELDGKYHNAQVVVEQLEKEVQKLKPLAEQFEAIADAEAKSSALQTQIESLNTTLSEEKTKQSEPGPDDPGGVPMDLGEREQLDRTRNSQADANSVLSAFKERKRIMEETFERMAQFAGLALQHSQEEADWRKLANLIGRDGIQSALVDAAGPELSETVNYFLHTCFGNRWSQTISTQRESSDGKKTIEQCKVWVIDQGSEEDNAPPREGEGITFSGGEQEILSLAFQLALTYLARNSGIIEPDIYLDEPASSLNESMRAKWVHMLRVAAGLIGCKHIHFISHNEDVKRLADARVKVERGTATIVQGDNNG